MAVAASSAAPHVGSVSPQTQKPGGSISISGSGFGTDPGYVTFAGLWAAPENWSSSRIAVTVPEGASSGNICVVDAAGLRSTNGPAFTVDYADRVESEWRISHPDDFTLKDYGHFGAANRIEARGRFLFVHYSTGVATYDTSRTPYVQKSNFYLPSKMADWKLHGDYLYMVGDFGLRIYEAGELERGDSREPVLRGAFTGKQTDVFPPTTANVTFRYVAIQDCSALPITLNGEPFNGTLVAAAEFYDPHGSPRIFFFEWDGAAETLRLLTVYGGAHFLNINVPLQQPDNPPLLPLFRNRNYLFCLAFDPLNPKLYVAAGLRTTHDAGAKFNYLYEFDISALDNLSVNNADALLRIEDHNHNPNDMVVYRDKLWIALYAAFSYPSARAFNGYDLHAGSTTVSERTYIDACHPEAPTNTTHNHLGHLALIPEQGLMVGTTGMSTDSQTLHNVFLFSADTPTDEHVPLASSESIDWSQDIAATTGKVYIADEWVNVVTLPYTFDGTNAVIQHHPEPPWDDPTRIFGGGWFSANMWVHDHTLYVGSGATRLFAIDARDLGDFTRWRSWNDKWSVDNGTHLGAGDYIFAIGFEENFVVAQDGARLLLIHEDPETGEFALANASNIPHFPMKMSNLYMNSSSSAGGGYSSGVRLAADNVVIFTIPDHGLLAYYVDPATTTMQQRAQIELATKGTVAFGYVAQTFTDVDFVDPGTLAVSESWTQGSLFPPAPEPDWGGIHFYRIDYPDGGPPTPDNPELRIGFSFTGELECLKGYQVDALATGRDGWVTARIHWKEGLSRNRRTVLFKYDDVARLNALSNDVALAEIMMPLTNFTPAVDKMGIRSACFRQDGMIVIPVGCEQWDGNGKTGVYVFDRSTKEQVHYYPGGRCGSAFYDPQHFSYYPNSNVQLVPAPMAAFPAGNGDVFIGTQWAGQIARLGRQQGSPTPPVLENAYVRLGFNGANYALTNILNKTAGVELSFGANAPLWQILLLNRSALSDQVVWAQHFADVWATDANATPTRNHYLEDTGPEQILHLDWTDVPLPYGGTATVNAEVRLPDDTAESVWTIAVETTGPTDALWRVTFPLVLLKPIGGDNTDDIAAVPIRSGLLVPDPHTNKVAGFSPYDAPLRYGPSEIAPDANDIFKSALGGVHPGRWEMQWMHVYDDGSRDGLFLRSTDTNGYIKALTMCPVYQASPIGTLLHWQHYPGNNTVTARDYTPPYDVRLRPISGDWFDAARLYRSWLTSQVWCARGPLIDNPDFPHPDTNSPPVGVGMTVKCGGPNPTFPSVGAMIEACEEWETFFGAEGGMGFLREWGWPVTDPYFRPYFTNAVAALNANGWSVLPYTGSWLWNTNAADDAAGTLAASAGATLNGGWNTENRWHAYTMCPAAAKWRDKYVSLTDDLQVLGCTHQYCDLYPIARLCYATNHNHTGGGGNYWIEGYRAMVAEARAHTRSNHAEAAWMPEHRSELGLDLFDHYWVQYWTYLENVFKGFVPAGVPVPIIAATVHDYIGCTSSAGEEHADFVNAGGTPDGRLPWRFVQAWSFVNGNTMSHGINGSPDAALSSPEARPDFLYLKDLKHHRAAALDCLLYGEFLRPPDTGSGTVGIPLWGRDYAQPRILGGAFGSRGGEVGIFMTNYDPAAIRTADYTIRRVDYGLTNGTYAIRSTTPEGEAHYGGFRSADYRRKWQFAPGGILMLKIAAVADAEGDGMGDAWASTNGVSDPNADGDADGLSNRQEFQYGCNPNSADTDGDGDSDPMEVERGTDPRDASSRSFLFTGIGPTPSNAVVLAWRDVGTNYQYIVDTRTALPHGAWTSALGSWPTPATNWTSGAITSAVPRFYRVRAVMGTE